MRTLRGPRGVTLLELMTVVAILAIVAGLAAFSFRGLAGRTAANNASHDLFSALQVARARATQTGSNVWFIVYPKGGSEERGAWFIFEDRDGAFADSASAFNYANHFSPTTPAPADGVTEGQLFAQGDFADYGSGSVTFGFHGEFSFAAPFTSLNPTTNASVACSFCRPASPFDTTSRGAIVFNGDGVARFIDDDGDPISPQPRSASLAIISSDQKKAVLFAVSAATGFIAQYSR